MYLIMVMWLQHLLAQGQINQDKIDAAKKELILYTEVGYNSNYEGHSINKLQNSVILLLF